MEKINYEEINNTPISLEVRRIKEEINILKEQIKIKETEIINLYDTCKHTYKTDYDCYCGPYESLRVCTKCGHSVIR